MDSTISPPEIGDTPRDMSLQTKEKQRKVVQWDSSVVEPSKRKLNKLYELDGLVPGHLLLDQDGATEDFQRRITTGELLDAHLELEKQDVAYLAGFLHPNHEKALKAANEMCREDAEMNGIMAAPTTASTRAKRCRQLGLTLEKEIHDMIYCRSCKVTHHVNSAIGVQEALDEGREEEGCPTTRFVSDGDIRIPQITSKAITFGELQLAVKHFVAGNYRNAKKMLQPLESCDFFTPNSEYSCARIQDWLVTPDKRLLLRIQHWHLVPKSVMLKPLYLESALIEGSIPGWTKVCRHLLSEMGGCIKYTTGTGGTELKMCGSCATEFQINEMKVDTGNAVIMTVWRDMGRCLTLDDPRFTSHFAEMDIMDIEYTNDDEVKDIKYRENNERNEVNEDLKNQYLDDEDVEDPNDHQVGEIRMAFEGVHKYDSEALEASISGIPGMFSLLAHRGRCSQINMCGRCIERYSKSVLRYWLSPTLLEPGLERVKRRSAMQLVESMLARAKQRRLLLQERETPTRPRYEMTMFVEIGIFPNIRPTVQQPEIIPPAKEEDASNISQNALESDTVNCESQNNPNVAGSISCSSWIQKLRRASPVDRCLKSPPHITV